MASNDLESAIPPYLCQARTTIPRLSENFVPPYPSYASRFPTSIKEIVMAVIGAQYHQSRPTFPNPELAVLSSFTNRGPETARPPFWDTCSLIDKAGAYNLAVIAYWPSVALYEEWKEESGFARWWQDLQIGPDGLNGWFLEVFSPTMDRWETVNSTMDVKEGGSRMREGISAPLIEHGYWGSTRVRLPISQVDELEGEKSPANNIHNEKKGDILRQRVRVPGKKNLCVIRSGQDWSSTSPEERQLYLETMHPVLIRGMDFLRDSGLEIGCYSCRFMDIVNDETGEADKERTFGLAYFDDLASLEKWSRSHKTHLDIFGGFAKYAKRLGDKMTLKLWHEVLVLKPEQQFFEYVGCHERTGFLAAM